MNRLDHEKLDIYPAAIESLEANRPYADPDRAPCRGSVATLVATLVATKAGATNFFAFDPATHLFAFDLTTNFFAVRFFGHGHGHGRLKKAPRRYRKRLGAFYTAAMLRS